jgi:hypothetical protein
LLWAKPIFYGFGTVSVNRMLLPITVKSAENALFTAHSPVPGGLLESGSKRFVLTLSNI